ncbi:MAG: DUF58 domain-containing protein [Gemmatimonadaceae bacterium]|nr:DUF58 domain-containing protein [Gemmatimonadaceae bacterium]
MIVPSRTWFAVAAGLALVAPLAFVWQPAALLLLGLDAAWLAALAVDAWRGAGRRTEQVAVERDAPPAFSAGRALPVRYRWTNRGADRVELRVRETLPSAFVALGGAVAGGERRLLIAAGAVVHEDLSVRPVRRGHAREGTLHLRVRSPWGLAWHQSQRALPWQATVFPSLQDVALRALPTQAMRRRESGLRNVRRLGEGRVFESLREWVPGDDTRAIDWKASARRGKPMARQFEDERRQYVLIAIDAGRMLTAESEGRPRLEAVIDAALQLAYAAMEHDDNVGLLVFADTVQAFVAPARGRRAMRQVLEALAAVEGRLVEPDYPAAFAWLAARNRKRALTVVFTDVIDRTASDALVAQVGSLRPRHLPLAVTLRHPEIDRLATTRVATVAAAFERAAAEELLQARESALADMRSRGVLVLDVPPASAARAVVDQYTLLKRRGSL